MQSATASPPTHDLSAPERWGRVAIACRVALILGWAAMLAVAVGFGARQSTYPSLEDAVEAGQVHAVQVTSDAPVGRGRITVELFWRHGPVRYTTEVLERSVDGSVDGMTGADVPEVVPYAVADQLRHLGVRVTVRPEARDSSDALLGWRIPQWSSLPVALLCLATLVALVSGPAPWLATRWAWIWLMTEGRTIGFIAYLLLAGPVPFARPLLRGRRLTGGKAFVLALVVSAVGTLASTRL